MTERADAPAGHGGATVTVMRRRWRWAAVALVALVATAGLWAVVSAGDEPVPSSPTVEDPGPLHVHGVGVNPSDGTVTLASHTGIFRVEQNGELRRVGTGYRDVMAFTVLGADHFLGSGHPDVEGLRSGEPGLVGLIESTDGGRSWESRSLAGEADLHALVAAHDVVFGWDSTTGKFMVTNDLQRWETRSTLDLVGFAIDPQNSERIVAAARSGVVESSDGGRTWDQSENIRLAAVSWTAGAGLWGVDIDGVMWGSDGNVWTRGGELSGTAQAIGAHGATRFVVVHSPAGSSQVRRSVDGGRSWSTLADIPDR